MRNPPQGGFKRFEVTIKRIQERTIIVEEACYKKALVEAKRLTPSGWDITNFREL